MSSKMSSIKWRIFCLNVLMYSRNAIGSWYRGIHIHSCQVTATWIRSTTGSPHPNHPHPTPPPHSTLWIAAASLKRKGTKILPPAKAARRRDLLVVLKYIMPIWRRISLAMYTFPCDEVQELEHLEPRLLQDILTLTPAWMKNYIHYKNKYETTYPFPNFTGSLGMHK